MVRCASGAGTPVPLWHTGMVHLCPQDSQGGRQPGWEWREARALDTQEEDPGGDEDSRLLGRDAAFLPRGEWTLGPQLPVRSDLSSDGLADP